MAPTTSSRTRTSAVLILLALYFVNSLAAIKIHPIGDSTTEWGPCSQNFRWYLWNMLIENGYTDVDFVGSISGPDDCGSGWDRDHDGHSGAQANQVLNGGLPYNHSGSIQIWAPQLQPDIALIHLGTNDLRARDNPQTVVGDLSAIIDVLRSANPSVIVLLCQITPATSNWFSEAACQSLNAGIAVMGAEKSTAASPVVVVDQYTGYSASADTRDGLHPGTTGAQKMATRYYEQLTPFLVPDETPPSVPTNVIATADDAQTVQLQWTASNDEESGVSGYVVYRNDSAVDTGAATTYTDSLLTEQTTYTYRISAVNRALLESALSSAVTVSTPADQTPPTITDISAPHADSLTIRFSEKVSAAQATTPSSYTLSGGITVERAELSTDQMSVVLIVSSLALLQTYTITVDGICDQSQRINCMAAPASVEFVFNPVDIKINCGGPTVDIFENDLPYLDASNQGQAYPFDTEVSTTACVDPAPAEVYATVRHQNHTYSFAELPDGLYAVRIHFTDAFGGDRRMDYTIEGQKYLDDFNIVDEAGGVNTVIIKDFSVEVTDGNGLQILCESDQGNDVFESAIEVRAALPSTVVRLTETATPNRLMTVQATGTRRVLNIRTGGKTVLRLFDLQGRLYKKVLFTGAIDLPLPAAHKPLVAECTVGNRRIQQLLPSGPHF